jgi:hypothetical protein
MIGAYTAVDIIKRLVEKPLVFCIIDLEAAIWWSSSNRYIQKKTWRKIANDLLGVLNGAEIGSKNSS